MKYSFAATVPLLLAGCSLLQSMNGTSVNETLHYQCGTTKLTVTQNNKQDNVSFIMDGKQLTLPQVRAASGAKYSDGHYTFWSKGDSAFIEREEKVIINDCVLIK